MSEAILPEDFLSPTTLKELINSKGYIIYNNQLVFYYKPWRKFVITKISENKKYTVEHHKLLPEGVLCQLIEGELIFMSAPFVDHQRIVRKLSLAIESYIDTNQLGEVLFAPCDVHFDDKNIFQPDILFVSIKRTSIIRQHIFGAPDFIVEVLSKGTTKKDRVDKMKIYGKFGVDEYWIVNIKLETIEVYHNTLGIMVKKQTATIGDTIQSKAISGFTLSVDKVFV